jgi:hypothetical protein
MQIIDGLDPNQTVNAWGGPTYLGALLAHYLDCIIGFYAAAFLLSRLLLPAADADRPLRPPEGHVLRDAIRATSAQRRPVAARRMR